MNRELLERANHLRMSDQNALADKIYNQLLEDDPNNDEYIFCKAMNVSKSQPREAVKLFTKVLELSLIHI